MVTGTVNISGFEKASMEMFIAKGAQLLSESTGFRMLSLANNQYDPSTDGSQAQTTIITATSEDGSNVDATASLLQKAGRLVCHLEAYPADQPGVLKYRFVCEPPG